MVIMYFKFYKTTCGGTPFYYNTVITVTRNSLYLFSFNYDIYCLCANKAIQSIWIVWETPLNQVTYQIHQENRLSSASSHRRHRLLPLGLMVEEIDSQQNNQLDLVDIDRLQLLRCVQKHRNWSPWPLVIRVRSIEIVGTVQLYYF